MRGPGATRTPSRREARARAILLTAFGTIIGVVPISIQINQLAVLIPGESGSLNPVTFWPLEAINLAVGMLVGPAAGFIAGIGSQVISIALEGTDLASVWTWVLLGGLSGALAGLLPRLLPPSARPSGSGRLLGAAAIGLVASLASGLITLLDPVLRAGVTPAQALASYAVVIVPTGLVAALILPLLILVAERAGIAPEHRPTTMGPLPRPRPSWQPFAAGIAIGAVGLSLGIPAVSNVRLIGGEAIGVGPIAAPGPNAVGPSTRTAELAIGPGRTVDRSCSYESSIKSEVHAGRNHVTLMNDSGRDVLLAWIDFEGRRSDVTLVEAGSTGEGDWGTGHPFVIANPDGACLVIFEVIGSTPLTLRLVP